MRIKIIVIIIASFITSCSVQRKIIFGKNSYARLPYKATELTKEQIAKENEVSWEYPLSTPEHIKHFYKSNGVLLSFSDPMPVDPKGDSLEKFKKGLDASLLKGENKHTTSLNDIGGNQVFLWKIESTQQWRFSFEVRNNTSQLRIRGAMNAQKQDSTKAEKILYDFFKGVKL